MCRDWKAFSGKLLMRLALSDLKMRRLKVINLTEKRVLIWNLSAELLSAKLLSEKLTSKSLLYMT